MSTVFENVEGGHCCSGEAVDEEGFELALCEVNAYEEEGEGLKVGGAGGVGGVGENGVEEGVD